jgi:hypothetical protein
MPKTAVLAATYMTAGRSTSRIIHSQTLLYALPENRKPLAYHIITAHSATASTPKMAPSAIVPEILDFVQPKKDSLNLPGPTRARLEKSGIDLSQGYPVSLATPLTLASTLTNTAVPPSSASLPARCLRHPRPRQRIHRRRHPRRQREESPLLRRKGSQAPDSSHRHRDCRATAQGPDEPAER